MPTHVCMCFFSKHHGVSPEKGGWKNEQEATIRQMYFSCIYLTNLEDPPIFSLGLLLTGLEWGLTGRGCPGYWELASSPHVDVVVISSHITVFSAKFPGKHAPHIDRLVWSKGFNLSWPSVLHGRLRALLIPGQFVLFFSLLIVSIWNPRLR